MLKVCLCEIKVALLNIVEYFPLSPMFIVVQNSVVNTSFREQVVSECFEKISLDNQENGVCICMVNFGN